MSTERWRLIDLEYDDPFMSLAVEEAIFIAVGKGIARNTIRFWRNLNAVVVGRYQHVDLEVNREACERHHVTIVRRFTGGGTVYHDDGNLNYAISIQRGHSLITSNPLETLKILIEGVIEGLRNLGLVVAFEPPGSIQVSGRKIGGIAGALKRGAIFYHGTLLVKSNLNILSDVLNVSRHRLNGKHVSSVPARVTTIQDELGGKLSMLEVKEALKHGFEKTHSIKLMEGELSNKEKVLAQQLYKKNIL